MIRVLIADDEPMIRAGVRAVLATDPDIEVVAEAVDGHDAVELVRRHRPEVAVLDIRMPGINGIDAAAEIRNTVLKLPRDLGHSMLTPRGRVVVPDAAGSPAE
ncbi:YesN/AraC family two-component response regulator [Streptomyces canus]|nr:YesN/AraC family two-component response regulator [Streptomyces canus]